MINNVNSSKNQEIKGKFVSREVFSCVTGMVEYIIKQGFEDSEAPFSLDDAENYYLDNSSKIETLEEKKEELETQKQEEVEESEGLFESEEISEFTHNRNLDNVEEKYKKSESQIDSEIEELENEQEEPQEVYEWWIVSSWLGEKLKEHGEVIIDNGLNTIWGRGTSGQAILLDGVISEICEELEILEGQKNEWK